LTFAVNGLTIQAITHIDLLGGVYLNLLVARGVLEAEDLIQVSL